MRTTLKKRAPRAKKSAPMQFRAQPLLGGQLPADMGPSFCSFVRHMLQSTAARFALSDIITIPTRKKFISLVEGLNWNGSSGEAKKAIEDTIEFLVKLQKAHEKAGDRPFQDEEDREIFFKNIYLARLYLDKVLNMLVGGPHVLVKENVSLERIIGDTEQLVKANGSNSEGCKFEQFANRTVAEMAEFVKKHPRHPAATFIRRSKMTLGEFAAHVQGEREEASRKKPFEVDYAHATNPDTNMLNADQIEIFLLLENLLTNAKRAGATEVKITSKRSLLNPRMAEISVEDNGSGFTRRLLKKAKVGDSFSTKRKANGEMNGVGLIHCRFIVEQHGGTFSIDSTRGKGSTFTFTLPLAN